MSEVKPPALKDLVNAPLKVTGADIPAGSYPVILYGFGEPFVLPVSERFKKPGGPTEKSVFEAHFGTFDKAGRITGIEQLLPVPEGGSANRRSNVYKMLKALGMGDAKLLDDQGNFAAGVNLTSFIGKTGIATVKLNDKGFPTVESIAAAMAGLKYPTLEECKGLSSEDIPF